MEQLRVTVLCTKSNHVVSTCVTNVSPDYWCKFEQIMYHSTEKISVFTTKGNNFKMKYLN